MRCAVCERLRAVTIAEVAQSSGLTAHTIRYYERAGVLPKPTLNEAGRRDYNSAQSSLIMCVGAMRRAGMSINDMKAFAQDSARIERCVLDGKLDRLPPEVAHRWFDLVVEHRNRLAADLRELETLLAHAQDLIDILGASV